MIGLSESGCPWRENGALSVALTTAERHVSCSVSAGFKTYIRSRRPSFPCSFPLLSILSIYLSADIFTFHLAPAGHERSKLARTHTHIHTHTMFASVASLALIAAPLAVARKMTVENSESDLSPSSASHNID